MSFLVDNFLRIITLLNYQSLISSILSVAKHGHTQFHMPSSKTYCTAEILQPHFRQYFLRKRTTEHLKFHTRAWKQEHEIYQEKLAKNPLIITDCLLDIIRLRIWWAHFSHNFISTEAWRTVGRYKYRRFITNDEPKTNIWWNIMISSFKS